MLKRLMVVFLGLLIMGCVDGSGNVTASPATSGTVTDAAGNSFGNTAGVISLSGDDVAIVGSQLDTGFVATSLASGMLPDFIVIVDSSSEISLTAPGTLTPELADPANGFVLVVTDDSAGSGMKAISMNILVGGVEHPYACSTPVTVFIECGAASINLDISGKTVSFDNAVVTNTDTSTVLTLDGILTW